ncbi:toll/interleukin-1 receptor domain-containing protein [bacterium]|nr:toll/interleukin-1 receptor domain-containing protein [bacterium]
MSSDSESIAIRDVVFISHANPEDNEFALWISTQLALHGYKVWCDLTQLIGGETFWTDIQQIIQLHCVKFIFVLSRNSNYKNGTLNEIAVATSTASIHRLDDFIIPLHIDDLPHSETYVEIKRLNAIPFENGWATGLAKLIEKLEKDGVPHDSSCGPSTVASWWRNHSPANRFIITQPQHHLSNWFPIENLTSDIYFHKLTNGPLNRDFPLYNLPYPVSVYRNMLISFASADGLCCPSGPRIKIDHSKTMSLKEFLSKGIDIMDARHASNTIIYLLRVGWEREMRKRQLIRYQLAKGAKCYFFRDKQLDKNKITFVGTDGKTKRRAVVGVKNRTDIDGSKTTRFWHFGIEARPQLVPLPTFRIKPHVVFSDDGAKAWDNKDKQHRARRQQCWDWWNDDWRDRLLAVISWLTNENGSIDLALGEFVTAQVDNRPVDFYSQVRYEPPESTPIEYSDEPYPNEWDEEDV